MVYVITLVPRAAQVMRKGHYTCSVLSAQLGTHGMPHKLSSDTHV
jgi:hypothetical protein